MNKSKEEKASIDLYWKLKQSQELYKGDLEKEEIVCVKIIKEALTHSQNREAEIRKEERERIKAGLKKIPDGEYVKFSGLRMNSAGIDGWNNLRYALIQNFDTILALTPEQLDTPITNEDNNKDV